MNPPNISLNEQTFLNPTSTIRLQLNCHIRPVCFQALRSKKSSAFEAAQQTTTTNKKIISNGYISYHWDDLGLKIFVSEPASILEGK